MALVIDGFRLCFSQIGGVQASVGIEDLAVAQLQTITVHLFRVDGYEAGKVLPKVQNGHVSPLGHRLDGHFLPDAHAHGTLFQDFRHSALKFHRLQQLLRPVLVVDLAVVEAGIVVGRSHRLH